MTLKVRTSALVVVATVVALSLTGCGGGSDDEQAQCLDDAQGYIPTQIGGKDVSTQDALSESLANDVQREGVTSIASGYISSDMAPATTQPGEPPLTRADGTPIPPDDPTQRIPEVIAMAAVGEPDVVKAVEADPGVGSDVPARTVDVDGVEVTIREFPGQNEFNTALATAQPCDTVILMVFAFKNGGAAAESAVREMLAASSAN